MESHGNFYRSKKAYVIAGSLMGGRMSFEKYFSQSALFPARIVLAYGIRSAQTHRYLWLGF